jgi:thioredoxin 1
MKDITDSKFNPTDYPIALIDFWGEWCTPCKALMPTITKLSNEFTDVAFFKANVENNTELASKHEIIGIPTLVLFKNGNVVEKLVGVQSEVKIKEALQRVSEK